MDAQLGKTPEGQRFGLVAYLDLLGARSLFASASSEALRDLLDYAGNYRKSASDAPGMPQTPFEIPREFVAFQDSLVRCTEIGWTASPEALPVEQRGPLLARWVLTILEEIASLRDIQLNFVCKRGMLLRGAIALGSYDITDGRVHGPAFMNALQGEEKWAKYPRILVDAKMLAFSLTSNPRHGWVEVNTRTDDDGYHFIDYLVGASREAPWDASYFVEYAEEHKYLIEAMLRGEKATPPDKVSWLHSYHDRSIRSIRGYLSSRGHIDPDDLMVSVPSSDATGAGPSQ